MFNGIMRYLACSILTLSMFFLCSCSRTVNVSSSEDNISMAAANDANTLKLIQQAKAAQEKEMTPRKAVPVDSNGIINLSLTQSILFALENNNSLSVQRSNPEIQRTFEQQELAVFDPVLRARVANDQTKLKRDFGSVRAPKTNFNSVDASIEEYLPTGTLLSLGGTTGINELGPDGGDFYTSRANVSVTQSLLRGFGPAVNLASVNQARIETTISQYELRSFTENLIAETETTYWNYVLAQMQIQIFKQSLELAEQQMRDTQERINVGILAASELPAAQAEVASRRENLINAKSRLAQTRLNLLRLINPSTATLWDIVVIPASSPTIPDINWGPVQSYVAVAMQMRPEMNQAKLQLQSNELELVKTRNGLLPVLDFFITYGRTGYANSFGTSVDRIGKESNYDTFAGVNFELPPINRAARARNTRAILTRNQTKESMNNLEQLIEVDVRSAYIEIERAHEQVAATRASRVLQAETLRAETEKFRVGKSTSLLVAQAQRDFLLSQIQEVQSLVNYINAIVEFYRLEGTLLQRRGIESPGSQPVKLTDFKS